MIACGGCLLGWMFFSALATSAERATTDRHGYVRDQEAGMLTGMFAYALLIAALVLGSIAISDLLG